MAKKRRKVNRKPKKEETPKEEEEEVNVENIVGEERVVSVEEVKPNTFNYNKQSDFIFEKMRKSLQEFGFVDPILVRSANEKGPLGFLEVIGGEHRLKAATDMGYTQVPVRDIGAVSDAQAKKLCIVLNETKGRPDNDALASLISSLNEEVGLKELDVLPYDESEMAAFLDIGAENDDWDTDFDDFEDDTPSPTNTKETLVAVMGILEVSKKKEKFLIAQYRSALEAMAMENKPVRAFEKMISDTIKRYNNA